MRLFSSRSRAGRSDRSAGSARSARSAELQELEHEENKRQTALAAESITLSKEANLISQRSLRIGLVVLVVTVLVGAIGIYFTWIDKPQDPPDPDIELEAFRTRLATEDPGQLLAEIGDRQAEHPDAPHLLEIEALIQLELGVVPAAAELLWTASEERRSARCRLARLLKDTEGLTEQVEQLAGLPAAPTASSEVICTVVQSEIMSMKLEPPEDILKFTMRAVEEFPNSVELNLAVASIHADNHSVDKALAFAEKAHELDPLSPYTRLSYLQTKRETLRSDDFEEWDSIGSELEQIRELAEESNRPLLRDAVNVELGYHLSFHPQNPNKARALDLLISVSEASPIQFHAYTAMAMFGLILASQDPDEITDTDIDSLRSMGSEIAAARFAPLFTVSGYRLLSLAEHFLGDKISAEYYGNVAEDIEKLGYDPTDLITPLHPLPSNLGWSSTGCKVEPTCPVQNPREIDLENITWHSPEDGGILMVLSVLDNGSVAGAFTYETGVHQDGSIYGDIVDHSIRARWCEEPSDTAPNEAGPMELLILGDGDVLTIEGRYLFDGSVSPAAWTEEWDFSPIEERSPTGALRRRANDPAMRCAP